MNTVRIELGDNDWTDMFEEITHGTSRRVEALYAPLLNTPEGMKRMREIDQLPEDQREQALYDFVKGSPVVNQAADIMILFQTKTWSFGAVNQETLDRISEKKRALITAKGNEIYGRPLAGKIAAI